MQEESVEFSRLQEECIAFSRYLIGQTPDSYVIQKYQDAHRLRDMFQEQKRASFDNFLLRLPKHRLFLKLIDVYTLFFFKKSILRKKWFLLMAILESREATAAHFDFPDHSFAGAILLGTMWNMSGLLITLAAAIVVLGPVNLFFLVFEK